MEKLFFNLSFTAATASTALFLVYAWTRRDTIARWAKGALIGMAIFHTLTLTIRTIVGRQMPGHDFYVPWSNGFETLSFLSLVIALEYLVIQSKRDVPILGAFIMPLVFTCLMLAVHAPSGMQIPTLTPVLQSYWLAVHVPVMLVAYAAFANAFGLGIAYLIQERQIKSRQPSEFAFRLPALDDLDQMIHRVIWWAFPVLTLGVLLGAGWAYRAWGRYWDWDPKEISSAITIAVYGGYLLTRSFFGWRGRKAATLSLVGFVIVILSYVGANHISPLHGFLSAVGK